VTGHLSVVPVVTYLCCWLDHLALLCYCYGWWTGYDLPLLEGVVDSPYW